MPSLLHLFVWLAQVSGLVWLLLVSPVVLAGSIGFSVEFTADVVSIRNTGTEAGYRLSLWTLDKSAKWQKVRIISGNSDYLASGKSLKGSRHSPVAATGLGRGDPLLVVLFDQAGSRIAQLAWRQAPTPAPYSLPTERHARQLDIAVGNANAAKIVATHGITVPYEGITQLAHSFSAAEPPPDPLLHTWTSGPTMTFDTGAGQGGAWLVHETAVGDLQVQIVADGTERGKEQVPDWLNWVRRSLMTFAELLAGFGAALLVIGLGWHHFRHQRDRARV